MDSYEQSPRVTRAVELVWSLLFGLEVGSTVELWTSEPALAVPAGLGIVAITAALFNKSSNSLDS